MNKEDFQTNIDELTRTVFDRLTYEPSFFRTSYERKISGYRDKVYKEFMAGLTKQQKEAYNQLEDLLMDEMCVEGSKYFLLGMQVHLAIERLYNDPKTVLELFYKNAEVTIENTRLRSSGSYENQPSGN